MAVIRLRSKNRILFFGMLETEGRNLNLEGIEVLESKAWICIL